MNAEHLHDMVISAYIRGSLTPAQKRVIVRMYEVGPRRVHKIGEVGGRLEIMRALHRKNLAERTDPNHAGLWKGRLTNLGRRCARILLRSLKEANG